MSLQRYVILAFVAAAILIGWTIQAASVSAFAQFAVPDTRLLGLLNISSVLAVASGAIAFVALLRNQRAVQFSSETVAELTRVTWPTKDETVKASTTVVATALFTAVLLQTYDVIWKTLGRLFLFTEV